MHELSIAVSLADSVEEEVAAHPGAVVQRVTIQVGELAGVEPEALLFSWDCVVKGTSLAGCRLEIERGPAPRDLILCSIEIEAPP